MFGLAYILFFAVYLAVSIFVIRWAVRHAKKRGKNAWLWGGVSAFIMYNLVFWDWLPTVAAHKYYCSTEAGFWVYKTVDSVEGRESGATEALMKYPDAPSETQYFDGGYGVTHTYTLNSRFHVLDTQQDALYPLSLIRSELSLEDSKTGMVLARFVDFGTGNSIKDFSGMPLKFWLHTGSCNGGDLYKSKFFHFSDEFENMKGGERTQ